MNDTQFFHGTNKEFKPGDLVTSPMSRGARPRRNNPRDPAMIVYPDSSPYKSPLQANSFFSDDHRYAQGFGTTYQVEPTGPYHVDQHDSGWGSGTPYRSRYPLRVVKKVGV